jgi:hypothetical protein
VRGTIWVSVAHARQSPQAWVRITQANRGSGAVKGLCYHGGARLQRVPLVSHTSKTRQVKDQASERPGK